MRQNVLDAFAKEGGIACASPGELGAKCDVVLTVVVNAAQTETVLFGDEASGHGEGGRSGGVADAMKPGSVVLAFACATVSPQFAKALGRRLDEKGVKMLDAPLSGGAAKANSGEMTMMTSGSADAYAACEDVLDAIAGKVYRLGDAHGAGSKVKIIN